MAAKGYDGGDGEEQIVAALTALFTDVEGDVVHNVKTKYWVIGSAIEIAIERDYVKAMGLKGWMYLRFQKGETTGRECLQCWKDRDVFDRAYDWWKSGNTGFTPTKLTGPRFSNELCKAYRERLLSDADKLAKRSRKKMGLKELREEAARWRSRYDRTKSVILQWAEEDQREPRVIHAIEQEIAQEAEDEEGVAPLDVRRTVATGDEEDDDVLSEKQHPGVPEPDKAQDSDAVSEQHPGVDFIIVGAINVPPRHPKRPQKPVLALQHCVVQEPDTVDDLVILDTDTRRDPAIIVLSPDRVVADE